MKRTWLNHERGAGLAEWTGPLPVTPNLRRYINPV